MESIEQMIKRLCPKGVKYEKLRDICEIRRGVRVVKKQLSDRDGYPVYQMLSNYQGRKRLFDVKKGFGIRRDCGDGWMRILNFYFDRNLIQVKTYSTELNCYEEDTDSSFIIQIDWKWEERFCEK